MFTLSLISFSRSYFLLALSYVFLTASNIFMVTTFSGHENKLEGVWNIFSHIMSHVWVLLFPIINLASSLVVLFLTRFIQILIISSVIVIFNCLVIWVKKLYMRKVHQTKQWNLTRFWTMYLFIIKLFLGWALYCWLDSFLILLTSL